MRASCFAAVAALLFDGRRILLTSCETAAMPLVEPNFVSDERDLRRLKHGFRWTVDFLSTPNVRALCGQPFPVRFTDRLRRLNQKRRAIAS